MRSEDLGSGSDLCGGGVGKSEVSEDAIDQTCLGQEQRSIGLGDDVDAQVIGVVVFDSKIEMTVAEFINELLRFFVAVSDDDAVVHVKCEDEIFSKVETGVNGTSGETQLFD